MEKTHKILIFGSLFSMASMLVYKKFVKDVEVPENFDDMPNSFKALRDFYEIEGRDFDFVGDPNESNQSVWDTVNAVRLNNNIGSTADVDLQRMVYFLKAYNLPMSWVAVEHFAPYIKAWINGKKSFNHWDIEVGKIKK